MKQISICGDSSATDGLIGRPRCKNTTVGNHVQNLNTTHSVPSHHPAKPANFGLQTKKPSSVKTISAYAGQNIGAAERNFIAPAINVSVRRSKHATPTFLEMIDPALWQRLVIQLPFALEGLHGIFPTRDIVGNLKAQNGTSYVDVREALKKVIAPDVNVIGYLHQCLGRELSKSKYGLRRIPNDEKRPNLNGNLSRCSDWEKVSEDSK